MGTRPEGIKLAPLAMELRNSEHFEVKVISTGQHRAMLQQVLSFFGVKPDYELDLMVPNQTLSELSSRLLASLDKVLSDISPDIVAVQGDTTTAFCGALAAFYRKIHIAHIEAGLRTSDKFSPFPEEINRRLIAPIADFHFCPTEEAIRNLELEGFSKNLHLTGNTGIDALFHGIKILSSPKHLANQKFDELFSFLKPGQRMILLTAHRRENFGDRMIQIADAILELVEKFPDICIAYPMHLNPNVMEPMKQRLSSCPRIHLMPPLNYPELLLAIQKSYLILTDSGGIQEEAPSLGKPVLVLRETTERMEGITAGTALLVGACREVIVAQASRLLQEPQIYQAMAQALNPYGDGKAVPRIVSTLKDHLL